MMNTGIFSLKKIAAAFSLLTLISPIVALSVDGKSVGNKPLTEDQ
jgi:hypothetical protein